MHDMLLSYEEQPHTRVSAPRLHASQLQRAEAQRLL